MKKLLSMLTILGFLLVPTWSWPICAPQGLQEVYVEGTKKICVTTDTCVVVPEKAPDFQHYDVMVVGQRNFSNGNAIQGLTGMNDSKTVSVILLVIKMSRRVHIIAMQVMYQTGIVDKFEDPSFMKNGHASDHMVRVKDCTPTKVFLPFIEGKEV
jgi:hypothetical protein